MVSLTSNTTIFSSVSRHVKNETSDLEYFSILYTHTKRIFIYYQQEKDLYSIMTKDTVDVLMVGTGEYTTGYVGGGASDSDKGAGVVALTMFDLRRRGKVDRVAMCGVNVSFLFCLGLSISDFKAGPLMPKMG